MRWPSIFSTTNRPPLIFERLSAGGHLLQARQYEPGQGLKAFVLRKLQLVLAFEVANVDGSVEHQRRVCVGHFGLRGGYVEFVFQFSDQLLEHVFYADHSGGRTEFVDHDCQMPLALLEFA